jgi:hypothetical protein
MILLYFLIVFFLFFFFFFKQNCVRFQASLNTFALLLLKSKVRGGLLD